jgi:hypothetical protein
MSAFNKTTIFAGISMGILVGTIIGLSVAEVTGIILGALVSVLTTFFGLKEKEENKGNHMVIGSFALTCVFFIILGIRLRTTNFLSNSLQEEAKKYESVGFKEEEIKQIILIKDFGIIPMGYSFNKEAKIWSESGVLMAGKNTKICDINENLTLPELQETFKFAGLKYENVQRKLATLNLDSTKHKELLLQIALLTCEK